MFFTRIDEKQKGKRVVYQKPPQVLINEENQKPPRVLKNEQSQKSPQAPKKDASAQVDEISFHLSNAPSIRKPWIKTHEVPPRIAKRMEENKKLPEWDLNDDRKRSLYGKYLDCVTQINQVYLNIKDRRERFVHAIRYLTLENIPNNYAKNYFVYVGNYLSEGTVQNPSVSCNSYMFFSDVYKECLDTLIFYFGSTVSSTCTNAYLYLTLSIFSNNFKFHNYGKDYMEHIVDNFGLRPAIPTPEFYCVNIFVYEKHKKEFEN